MEFLKMVVQRSDPVRAYINVGCRVDIATGNVITGRYGESIINGGIGAVTATVGMGNCFKSTWERFQLLSALSKFMQFGSTANTYDTETNIQEDHQHTFTQAFDTFAGRHILNEGIWEITDKTIYTGDQFFDHAKDFLNNKIANKSKILRNTPFVNREVTAYMQMPIPTFGEVDSFSEFSTQDVLKMQEENTLGDSGANTVNMREGLQKNRFIRELTPLADGAKHYLFLVAHLGMEFNMDPRNPAPKKLGFLKNGIKIKGAPEKFTFLTNVCWYNMNASVLMAADKNGPEYPSDKDDKLNGETDLNEVTIKLIRNKNGPSGYILKVLISQKEGVLEDLTNFHYIKTNKRFGLPGNDRNYVCAFLPEVALSRTTIRGKLKENKALRRAIELTADLLQVSEYWPQYDRLQCSPEVLYEDIKKLGYDWSILLNTRGWWTFDNDKHPTPFLTIIDLLKMRAKEYIPYWYDKSTLSDELKKMPKVDRFKH